VNKRTGNNKGEVEEMSSKTMEAPAASGASASRMSRRSTAAVDIVEKTGAQPTPPISQPFVEPILSPELREERESTEMESGKRRMPDNLRRFLLKVQGGKYYLPAAYRIVWFRDECPDWGVETKLLEGGQEAGFATVQAKIYNGEGRLISSGIKTETRQDFPAGWVEKAETGSIARALAVAGFGTQFAPELDEEQEGQRVHRPADTPQRTSYGSSRAGFERTPYDGSVMERVAPRQGTGQTEIWEGPGLCPRCHAPEGKRHGKPCIG
jgi:hypothetical protein